MEKTTKKPIAEINGLKKESIEVIILQPSKKNKGGEYNG